MQVRAQAPVCTSACARENLYCSEGPLRAAALKLTEKDCMKTLVIAEKPSVAQDIVRAITPTAGKFEKHDEYFESDDWLVTSAVGHLVEIQAP